MVVNSRSQQRQNQTWRRRACQNCQALFTTIETPLLENLVMVQDGKSKVVPFSRDKLFLSIHKSCLHRPSAIQDAAALTDTVVSKLIKKMDGSKIYTSDIIKSTATSLKNFDHAAMVQFQAFHPLKEEP